MKTNIKGDLQICISVDLKINQYLRLHMKIISGRFHIKTPFICALELCQKFVYKYSETIE